MTAGQRVRLLGPTPALYGQTATVVSVESDHVLVRPDRGPQVRVAARMIESVLPTA